MWLKVLAHPAAKPPLAVKSRSRNSVRNAATTNRPRIIAAALLKSLMGFWMRNVPSLRYNAKKKTGMIAAERTPNKIIGMSRQPHAGRLDSIPIIVCVRSQAGAISDKMDATKVMRAVFLISTGHNFVNFASTSLKGYSSGQAERFRLRTRF